MSHADVLAAEDRWQEHYDTCAQCKLAVGPPPPGISEQDRTLYACDRGLELQEVAVRAAHE